MRTLQSLSVITLLLTAAASPAAADTLEATLRQPLREISHAVDVRIIQGLAVFKVQRSFANQGKRHDEASLRIALPFGAAATGLRIRSGRRWYNGELMERQKAARLYQKLTGMGPHAPRDPALLQWVWANEVHLQVFPVPPGETATVEYTLTAPTQYADGRYTISYPRHNGDANLAAPVVRVYSEAHRAKITVDGRLAARAQPVVFNKPIIRPLPGNLTRRGNASYTVSSLEVTEKGTISSIQVAVDVRHTFRADLEIRLVSPTGSVHVLHNRTGGSKNDVRKTYNVGLPPRTPAAGIWQLVVSDHAGMDVGQLVAWSVTMKPGQRRITARARKLPLVLPDAPSSGGDAGIAVIQVTPPKINTVLGRLGRVVAARQKQFTRLELDLAPRLSRLPRNLSVVFVVDASHSIGALGIKAQLAVAQAFLSHVPGAQFEVVLYRRHAKRMVGTLAGARSFEAQLTKARKDGLLKPGNGSALDEGLRLATRVLRQRARLRTLSGQGPGPGMIVMLSDNLLRPRWSNGDALRQLARLPKGVTAHVVIPGVDPSNPVREQRDDTHALAPIAATHGGVLLRVDGLPPKRAKALNRAVLGLVRPIRIDSVRLSGHGLENGHQLAPPDVLGEGTGLREMVQRKSSPHWVLLQGKIWARKFRRIFRVDRGFSKATAAFVFSHDMHGDLSNAEKMKVALMGRAVSPVTSYLAIEPGVRPSRAGIVRNEGGGVGGLGLGGGGRGGGGSGAIRFPPDLKGLIAPHVKRCAARHHPATGWSVTLTVETTHDEIVDVIPRGRRPTPMQKCLVEGTWKVRLTKAFDLERETFSVALP
ncbi:MAG: proprotein convertase P-domain-containing protein [bacterium]